MDYLDLNLHCLPGSKVEKIVGKMEGGALKVKIRAKAVDNAANSSLIELISHEFGVKISRVELIRGMKSKQKTIRIHLDSKEISSRVQKKLTSFD